jgi:hypothetical protein
VTNEEILKIAKFCVRSETCGNCVLAPDYNCPVYLSKCLLILQAENSKLKNDLQQTIKSWENKYNQLLATGIECSDKKAEHLNVLEVENDELKKALLHYRKGIENGTIITLPDNVVLNEYDKSLISKITSEEIKFQVGDYVYKVNDTVLHFANRRPKPPKYEIVEGKIKSFYHSYDNYHCYFEVRLEIVINEKGHYICCDQSNCYLTKEEAETKLKELQGKQ